MVIATSHPQLRGAVISSYVKMNMSPTEATQDFICSLWKPQKESIYRRYFFLVDAKRAPARRIIYDENGTKRSWYDASGNFS